MQAEQQSISAWSRPLHETHGKIHIYVLEVQEHSENESACQFISLQLHLRSGRYPIFCPTYVASHKDGPQKYSEHEAVILEMYMVDNDESWV